MMFNVGVILTLIGISCGVMTIVCFVQALVHFESRERKLGFKKLVWTLLWALGAIIVYVGGMTYAYTESIR